MVVKFTDNSVKVKGMIEKEAIAWLYEAAGEVESQTKRNVPGGGNYFSQQKNSWTYKVDEGKLEAQVGNPLVPALWTEFGTGEYSISEKGGRKGYWVYVKDNDFPTTGYTYKGGKQYTLEEARKTVAYLREKGLDAHYTKGQAPKRPLFRAFKLLKPGLIRSAQEKMRRIGK